MGRIAARGWESGLKISHRIQESGGSWFGVARPYMDSLTAGAHALKFP